tara:strand:+ start:821 stop:2026 length:1206 start_codon:yes stop_codon:yes gene_type:complete
VKKKNLFLQNNFPNIYLNKYKNKIYSKKFNKIFVEIKNDLDNFSKTLNTLKDFKFDLKSLDKFKKFKTIVLIGMGGSILGSEAIHGLMENKINKRVYFLNDLNSKKILNLKKSEDLNKALFIVISKSGNTIETLTNFFSLNIIKKDSKNIIIISERANNLLYNLAKKFNLKYVEHKSHIGGRYSVLSETGMIPAYLMGLNTFSLRKNIKKFLNGSNKTFLKNSTVQLANLLSSKKKNNLIFLNYSPRIEKFLFWCQQLIAESLGKNKNGFLPVVSNVPKDHHSLLQLYLDGPRDKIFSIFSINEEVKLKTSLKKLRINNFLHNKHLSEIKNAQQKALIKILKEKKLPFREFKIKKINEKVLGELFSYFILETVIIGKLVNLNPYNQPAVEQVKKYTKKILN